MQNKIKSNLEFESISQKRKKCKHGQLGDLSNRHQLVVIKKKPASSIKS